MHLASHRPIVPPLVVIALLAAASAARLGTVHAVVIREDRGETFALIRFEDLKKTLRNLLDQRLAARVDK